MTLKKRKRKKNTLSRLKIFTLEASESDGTRVDLRKFWDPTWLELRRLKLILNRRVRNPHRGKNNANFQCILIVQLIIFLT
jgi:hypothetical protein